MKAVKVLARRYSKVVAAATTASVLAAASAQAWTPTFDGVSSASIQTMFQSVLTSYQNYINALLIVIGIIVAAGVLLALLQKKSPVKM